MYTVNQLTIEKCLGECKADVQEKLNCRIKSKKSFEKPIQAFRFSSM